MAESWRVSELDVEISHFDDLPVIEARGECDLVTSRKLEDAVEGLLRTGEACLIVDLRETAYMDSSGFRILLQSQKKASAAGGGIVVSGLPAHIQRVLDIMKVGELIPIASTVEDAAAMLRAE